MTAAVTVRCQTPCCRFVLGHLHPETGVLVKARDVRMIVERTEGRALLQCPKCDTVRTWTLGDKPTVRRAA